MGVPLLYVHTGSDVTAMHSVKYWSCTGNVHHTVFARLHQVHNATQKAHSHMATASYNLKTHNSTFRGLKIILKAARAFNEHNHELMGCVIRNLGEWREKQNPGD